MAIQIQFWKHPLIDLRRAGYLLTLQEAAKKWDKKLIGSGQDNAGRNWEEKKQ